MAIIERFIVIMYSKGCGAKSVNEARHHLFTTGQKSLDNIPPIRASLYQHVKRALIQASFYWSQAIVVQKNISNFSEWGWNRYQKQMATLMDYCVMLVRHVQFCCTVGVQRHAQEDVSANVLAKMHDTV